MMSILPADLKRVFQPFEEFREPLSDVGLAETIGKWLGEQKDVTPEVSFAARAEKVAFLLSPHGETGKSDWGTYYGPSLSGTDLRGQRVTVPSISDITNAFLDYWKARSAESRHSALRARYADLVWDFWERVKGERPDHRFGRTAIGAYIEAGDGDLYRYPGHQMEGFKRALHLALSLNDETLVGAVRDGMLRLLRSGAEAGNVGVWTGLFDTLCDNKRVPLSEEQERHLIGPLESALERGSRCDSKGEFSPFVAKQAGTRLAAYYAKRGRRDDAVRVTRAFGLAFERLAAQADPPLAMAWLDDLRNDYETAGMKDDAARVQLKSKAKGARAGESMMKQSVEVSTPPEQLEECLKAITEGGLEKTLARIAWAFTVKKGEALKQLEETAADHPLLVWIPRAVIADDQVVARVGPLDDDLKGRVALQIAQTTAFQSEFLLLSLQRLMESYKPEAGDLEDYLLRCPLFDAERRGLLERGLEAWLNGDHVTAMHLLVPQVEHVLRRLLQQVGIPTNKPDRRGWMQEKNVWDILTDASLVASPIGEYLPYLRTLLADPRGLNLRNRLCHGLMGPNEFSARSSALVLHALLLIAQIRIQDQRTHNVPA